MTNWWGTRKNPSPRMVVEITAMKKIFNTKAKTLVKPGVRWDKDFYIQTKDLELVTTDPDEPYWLVAFRMTETNPESKNGSRDTFELRITYKRDFPGSAPWVQLVSHPDWPKETWHVYNHSDDVLCLTAHYGKRDSEWDPARSTAATVAVWGAQWIRAFIHSKKTGYWPETA